MLDLVRFVLMQRIILYNFYNFYYAYYKILRLKICVEVKSKVDKQKGTEGVFNFIYLEYTIQNYDFLIKN